MAENETLTDADVQAVAGAVADAKAEAAAQAAPAAEAAAPVVPAAEPGKIDMQLLNDVIDAIRPSFQADGGDIELIGVDENGVVTVEMVGACAGCMFASSDITDGIDGIIRQHVPGVTAVRPVMY